jgi:hypothetical protein
MSACKSPNVSGDDLYAVVDRVIDLIRDSGMKCVVSWNRLVRGKVCRVKARHFLWGRLEAVVGLRKKI